MAVAVLEKNTDTLEKIESTENVQFKNSYASHGISDEQHNAKIGEVYAKLINPNAKIDEILGRTQDAAPTAANVAAPEKTYNDRPYFADSARTDSVLFRADSPVNRRVEMVAPADEEEENEDLRPTPTTIQYKTYGVKKAAEEGKIETRSTEKRSVFSKKEKIAIAVVIAVIVAMFALIIINSAILSGINSEMSDLQSSLTTVRASYASVSDRVNEYLSNAIKNAEDFAIFKGMVK